MQEPRTSHLPGCDNSIELCKSLRSMKIIEVIWKNKRFCATVGSLNLGALCVGLAIGWPRPSFAYFYEPMDTEQKEHTMLLFVYEAWIESIINVGACLGSLASIFISSLYGRRISFSLSACILVAFWIFLSLSGLDKILIISAAAVAGLGVGIFSATAVLYVAEISTLESRGVVGTTIMLFGCLGIFAINLLGYLFEISFLISAMPILPLCFLASVYFLMIESPFYLFQKDAILQSKISLKHLRGRQSVLEIDQEYKSMEAFFNTSVSEGVSTLLRQSLCPKSVRSFGLTVAPVLCISQMLGVAALSDYAEQLIESTASPYSADLVTSSIDVLSTVLCALAIKRFGRKPLLIFSIAGSGLCCLLLAVYHLTTQDGQCYSQELLDGQELFPMVMLGLYYAIYALGLIPLLPIVTGEIFPSRVKAAAVGICTSLFYLIAFCVQRSYEALNQCTSSCFAFACFAMLGSVGLPLVIAIMPENTSKSLLQLQNELENGVVVSY